MSDPPRTAAPGATPCGWRELAGRARSIHHVLVPDPAEAAPYYLELFAPWQPELMARGAAEVVVAVGFGEPSLVLVLVGDAGACRGACFAAAHDRSPRSTVVELRLGRWELALQVARIEGLDVRAAGWAAPGSYFEVRDRFGNLFALAHDSRSDDDLPRRYRRWPTAAGRAQVSRALGVPIDPYSQDWEWETAVAARFDDYLRLYAGAEADARVSLMELLIQAVDDLCEGPERVDPRTRREWQAVERLVRAAPALHLAAVHYWAVLGEREPEAHFAVSAAMRGLWHELASAQVAADLSAPTR